MLTASEILYRIHSNPPRVEPPKSRRTLIVGGRQAGKTMQHKAILAALKANPNLFAELGLEE